MSEPSKKPVRQRTRSASRAPAQVSPPDDTSDYRVGYGKPPIETRFKPGQSGNRAGRPKRARNEATVARKVLSETVPTTMHGKRRNMTVFEASLRRQCLKSLEGDPKAFAIVERYHLKYFPESADADSDSAQAAGPGASMISEIFLDMAREAVAKEKNGGGEQ